jgi:hypothetical protein
MSQPAAPLILPLPKASDEAGIEATAFHVAEILEEVRVAEGVERTLRATGHLPWRAGLAEGGDLAGAIGGRDGQAAGSRLTHG